MIEVGCTLDKKIPSLCREYAGKYYRSVTSRTWFC